MILLWVTLGMNRDLLVWILESQGSYLLDPGGDQLVIPHPKTYNSRSLVELFYGSVE